MSDKPNDLQAVKVNESKVLVVGRVVTTNGTLEGKFISCLELTREQAENLYQSLARALSKEA